MIMLVSTIALTASAGIVLLCLMMYRDEPILGVWALTALCVSGVQAAFYGMIDSALS
jgi:hypothetical protein